MRLLVLVGLAVGLIDSPQDAVSRLREAWARQDAAGIVGGASRVVVQLPGEAATAPLSADQAARALDRLFRDATEIGLEVRSFRALGDETVYAEMQRQFRVRGSDETVVQRVFAAFRLDEGQWRLAELRIGTAGR